MPRGRFVVKSTTIWTIFPFVFAVNALWVKNAALGLVLLAAFLALLGSAVGRAAAPEEGRAVRWWLGVWQLLSALIIVAAAMYYAMPFSPAAADVLVILALAAAWTIRGRAKTPPPRRADAPAQRGWPLAAGLAALAGFASTLFLLRASATVRAVASPWDVVSPWTFVAFGAGVLALSALWFQGRGRASVPPPGSPPCQGGLPAGLAPLPRPVLSEVEGGAARCPHGAGRGVPSAGVGFIVPLTILALFVFLSVNLAVFPLGAGFDAFIHRATEAHIAATGSITPKPLYYAGQYALVVLLHHAFALPVDAVDLWLLPLLAAFLLPSAWTDAADRLLPERRWAPFTLALLFLLPLGAFATTTPQGLADLWILLLVLASVPLLAASPLDGPARRRRLWLLALSALATAAIHPLAGLPALAFVAYLAAARTRWLRRAIIAVGALLLPVSFLVENRGLGGRGLDLAGLWTKLAALFPAPPALGAPYHPALDFAAALGWAAGWIVLLLAILGWRRAPNRLRWAAAAMAGLLLADYVLLGTIVDFSYLIDYERASYAARLLPLALFFLAPLAMVGLGRIRQRLDGFPRARESASSSPFQGEAACWPLSGRRRGCRRSEQEGRKAPRAVRWFAVALAAGAVLGAWYAAYPRDDAYLKGHGYNVSQADFDAVKQIEADAGGVPYVGLADQSASVAALSTIGFRYFGDQFFYPIPTGGGLYQKFLDMNAAPTRATADAALNLVAPGCRLPAAGCRPPSRAYFVVDSYWWNAPAVVAQAKRTADAWFAVDGGQVTVFRYER